MDQNISSPTSPRLITPPLVAGQQQTTTHGPTAGPHPSSQQALPFAHQQRNQQQQEAAAAAVGQYYPPLSGASSASASASMGTPQSAESGASSTPKGFPTGQQQHQNVPSAFYASGNRASATSLLGVVPPPPGILPSSVGPMAVPPGYGGQQQPLYAMTTSSTMAHRPPFLSWRVQHQDEPGEGGGEGTVPQQQQQQRQAQTPSASANVPPLVFPSSENVAMYGPAAGLYTSSASIGTPKSAKSGALSTSKGFPTGGQQQQQTMAQTRAPCSTVPVDDLKRGIATTKTRINNEMKKFRDTDNEGILWPAFIALNTVAETLKNINEMSGVAPAEPTQPQTSAVADASQTVSVATEAGVPAYFLPFYYPDLDYTELSQPSTSSVSHSVELPSSAKKRQRGKDEEHETQAKRQRDDDERS